MNDLKKATVKSTGVEVEVYSHSMRGTWVDYSDCKTEYSKDELIFNK